MNRFMLAFSSVIAMIVFGASVTACGGGSGSATSGSAATTRGQVLPVTENPINNNATASGLEITSAKVEDNVDPDTSKDIADRLQVSLKNTSSRDIGNLEIFYLMKDASSGATEGYYQKLDGLNLAPGETRTVSFDNQLAPGHYPENKYSIYRTSRNEVDFTIEVNAPGFKPATGETKKAPGTSEQQD